MSYCTFSLEKNPNTISESSRRQLKWKKKNNSLYGVKPFCVIEKYRRNHIALYVPSDKDRRIIERKIGVRFQEQLPKHRNHVSQMKESERNLIRKYPTVPAKYYGLENEPTHMAHTGQIKDTSVYQLVKKYLQINRY